MDQRLEWSLAVENTRVVAILTLVATTTKITRNQHKTPQDGRIHHHHLVAACPSATMTTIYPITNQVSGTAARGHVGRPQWYRPLKHTTSTTSRISSEGDQPVAVTWKAARRICPCLLIIPSLCQIAELVLPLSFFLVKEGTYPSVNHSSLIVFCWTRQLFLRPLYGQGTDKT